MHEGIAGICAGAHAGEEHLTLAEEALRHLGAVVRVPEPYMDAVTAVSGSGPAYFALLAEAMIEAGILLGLSREVSTQLVVQTMLGTAKQLRDLKMHPVELREMVTSPGGTTIAAIRELEQAGVRAAFLNAIQAAMDRSRELARGDRSLNDVEIRVVEDPAREAAELLVEHAPRRPHRALRRLGARAAPTSSPRSSSPTGPERTSGSETSAPCRPDDERSNYRLVRETLLDRLAALAGGAPRSAASSGAEEAAGALRRGARRRHARPGAERHRPRRAHGLALPGRRPRSTSSERRAVAAEAGLEPFVPRVTMTPPVFARRGPARLPRHRRGEGARRCGGVRRRARARRLRRA